MPKFAALALAGMVFSCPAIADEPWVFEFEFAHLVGPSSRVLQPSCTKVVPVEAVQWYASDPRPGWAWSCGNEQPMYLHFLGRRCAKWKVIELTCGWRHFSSPFDNHEITFDAISVRGRFSW